MLDQFIYEDHIGRRFVGLDNGVYANYNELRDYTWSYDTINSRISRFYRSPEERKIPLVFCGANEAEAIEARNRLHDLTETDIEALIPGKIYIGDYYINGWINASAKSEYLIAKRYCNIEYTLISDDPTWYKENLHVFPAGMDEMVSTGDGADYPYDYMHDYAFSQSGQRVICDSIRDSGFRMRIYGTAIDPVINIGGNTYKINGSIAAGESLLIDSLTKTITLTTTTGNNINWFDKRSRDSYIFAPIPAGQNNVIWNGSFGFDLTVIEKRSEPKWT